MAELRDEDNIKELLRHAKKRDRIWKKRLGSDRGLFKKIKRPKNVVGPKVNDDGKIIGDAMALETTILAMNGTKEQSAFYQRLLDENPIAAKEYLLTVLDSKDVWTKDIQVLKDVLQQLILAERALKKEKKLLLKGEKLKFQLDDVHDVLSRHFPEFFRGIELGNLGVEQTLDKVKKMENLITHEESYLKEYIKGLKKELPFLF